MNADPGPEIRVVVVDDQALVRAGNALILDSEEDIRVIGEAADGAQAIDIVDQTRPDVVLMDVRMRAMDGIEATRRITARHPLTRIIVLTTFDLDAYAFGSLQAGASAFLLKSTKPAGLTEAIRTVASGAAVTAPRLTAKLIQHYLEPTPAARVQHSATASPAGSERDPLAMLSPRERDVFHAVVRGLTNAEISARLVLAPSTVKSHINSIFAKLGLRDRVHAVILGYELGVVAYGGQ